MLRKIVFWSHLTAGLIAGVVVFVMSVTGVLLTYQRQLTLWADTRGLDGSPLAAGAARLAPEALLGRVLRTEKGKPTAVVWRGAADAPVAVSFGRERTVFVNAYTGQTLGAGGTKTRKFFSWVTDWHRWMGAAAGEGRDRGKAITGASNLLFFFLLLSGAILWIPKQWRRANLRNIMWFRRGLRPKARDFNWHHVFGFWMFLPLAIIIPSGVVISYPWASNLVFRVMGETPPPRNPEGGGGAGGGRPAPPPDLAGLDPLWTQAVARVPGWKILTLQIPAKPDAPVSFTIDRGTGGQPQTRATLAFDRGTGRVTKWEPFAATSPGRKLRGILRFAHTGEVLGLAGQTLAGIASLAAALLVWTGISLSLRRFAAWRARRKLPRAAEAAG
ncbi:MAG TPA: PepSY-associated TM helix domain-containing protein [Longimicrobium sp.]|uniref:PepSY-associated TM helix domain-containing protein n=1 Tax=Longimicrobium sp. TaxID=2029185 RepID=UPI002ED99EFD